MGIGLEINHRKMRLLSFVSFIIRTVEAGVFLGGQNTGLSPRIASLIGSHRCRDCTKILHVPVPG